MSQTLIKYSPAIEQADPDFDKHLETIVAATKKYIEDSVKREGLNRAVRHGEYVAKLRLAPTKEAASQVTRRVLDPASAPEVYRPALVAELQEHPYEYDLQVQLCVDLKRMPVEDLTVEWPEALAPFVTVAKVRVPQQDLSGDKNLELQDATSITPWRVTQEHRPLGNLMRMRKEVYRQSSILRHELNHQIRREPRNLAEVFGSAPV